jgi:FAD dependent oxidoreductase
VAARKSSDYGRLFFQAEVFRAGRLAERRKRPDATVTEPAQRVPVFRDCDVLVAGGGPSGTAAAIAAARAGADVVLVERHNHLGGLSTGGLVIWIDRITGWSGEPVIAASARNCSTAPPRRRGCGWAGSPRSVTRSRIASWSSFPKRPRRCG